MAIKASSTPFLPMLIAACEQELPPKRRIATDALAVRVLPAPLRLLVRSPRGRAWIKSAVSRDDARVWDVIACRKRYFDDQVARAIADGLTRLVVLGAGFDTRAARLAVPAGVDAVELDLAVNIARKRRSGLVPPGVTLAPIDFEQSDLGETPAFQRARADPAVFTWEAVTQYLTEQAIHSVLRSLADAAPGSRLIFSYVPRGFIDGTDIGAGAGLHRRFVRTGVWKFGLDPNETASLLAEYGWTVLEQVGAAEFTERYLTPTGRPALVSAVERCATAEKNSADS